MVRHAVRTHGLDRERIFVTGLSAGGAMTAVMLAAYPELVAAGAVTAGLPYGVALGVGEAMSAMRHIPVLSSQALGDKVRAAHRSGPARWPRVDVWHGDADATVSPAAGEALARQWSDLHGAAEQAFPRVSGRRSRRTWLRPDGEVAVELHMIAGLDHGAPISSGGDDGCGTPRPWVLECGVSSSREIMRTWDLDRTPRPARSRRARPETPAFVMEDFGLKRQPSGKLGETIAAALRSSGLMR